MEIKKKSRVWTNKRKVESRAVLCLGRIYNTIFVRKVRKDVLWRLMPFNEQWDVSFNQMESQSDSLGYLPPPLLCISADDDDDNERNIEKGPTDPRH